ncbi:hypothetical protein N473_26205 [Pseudoalteromonas luteoviolacea CPMOR-1]|uniref:Uncharacterized protein n=2 Tax=Pseudoalteromonas luteoviolacea TaxID=43657 RepID=A0A167I5B4_9GAMM|nr:hypothetical protein N473_26205 [Pseudoalteromonas luteoviolacea CPMOR-1]
MPVGRPKKSVTASARCEFRVEPERKLIYEARAESQELKLSAWLKALADKDCGLEE